jgi:hypothetical protein
MMKKKKTSNSSRRDYIDRGTNGAVNWRLFQRSCKANGSTMKRRCRKQARVSRRQLLVQMRL